jgi:hypothetical protein
MREARVNKSELARRLKWHPPQVDRLLEMTHQSQFGQIEAAFSVLGKRLVFSVDDVVIAQAASRRSSAQRVTRGRARRTTVGTRKK